MHLAISTTQQRKPLGWTALLRDHTNPSLALPADGAPPTDVSLQALLEGARASGQVVGTSAGAGMVAGFFIGPTALLLFGAGAQALGGPAPAAWLSFLLGVVLGPLAGGLLQASVRARRERTRFLAKGIQRYRADAARLRRLCLEPGSRYRSLAACVAAAAHGP